MPLAETDRESDRHSRLAACNPLKRPAKPTLSGSGLRLRGFLSPDRPVFGAAEFDLKVDYRLGVDAEHGAGAVLGQAAVERLALHKETFGALALESELAMLEPLAASAGIRPGPRAVHVGRPQEARAGTVERLHRGLPHRDHHHTVAFAHAAPAGARVLQPDAARGERFAARQ